jgi:hypothetical protein
VKRISFLVACEGDRMSPMLDLKSEIPVFGKSSMFEEGVPYGAS